jgi:hypothetical protein
MSLAFDEYGRPFIILREQAKQARIRGVEAVKANILAAKTVARTLRSSLGPKGMDKMLQSPDGDVTISCGARGFCGWVGGGGRFSFASASAAAMRRLIDACTPPAQQLTPHPIPHTPHPPSLRAHSQRRRHHPGADGCGEPDRPAARRAVQEPGPRDRRRHDRGRGAGGCVRPRAVWVLALLLVLLLF